MRILITGVNGYLGSHLAKFLLQQNCQVVGICRPSSKLHALADILDKIDIHYTDSDLAQKVMPLDIIIHTATNYGTNANSALELVTDNEIFPLRILEYAITHDVTFINTHSTLSPSVNPYAISKNNFLQWGKYIANGYKTGKFINLRLEHFYGYKDGRFIEKIIKSLLNNLPHIDLTSGEQQRDFIYIKDVITAYWAVCSNIQQIHQKYCDIDIGCGQVIRLKDLVLLIKNIISEMQVTQTQLNFGAIPYRQGESMYSCANIEFLNKLGWSPQYTLKCGLLECVKEYLKG